MKKLVMITFLSFYSAFAAAQDIVCTVGDGKANTEPKIVTAIINKDGDASIDQEIGDYRIMAFWIAPISRVSIGIVEKVSKTTASTLLSEDMQGNLFASKNGQSVDLKCYVQ